MSYSLFCTHHPCTASFLVTLRCLSVHASIVFLLSIAWIDSNLLPTSSNRLSWLVSKASSLRPAPIVILPHVIAALLQLHPRQRIELVAPQQLQPIVSSSRSDRSWSNQAWQVQTVAFPQQRQSFFVRQPICPTFAHFQCHRRVLQQALRKHRFGRSLAPTSCVRADKLPRDVLTETRIFHCLLLIAGSFLSSCLKLYHVWAEVYRVRLSVVFHHYRRDIEVLETFLSALPVTHEFGFVPSSRLACRTCNEAQLLTCSRPCQRPRRLLVRLILQRVCRFLPHHCRSLFCELRALLNELCP